MRVTRPSEAPSITCETTLTSISNATILEPAQAEEALRFAHNRPIEWAAFAAVRACVTDPSDRTLSMFQVAGFIKDFDGRGMGSIRATIIEVLNDGRLLGAALSAAARHGVSNAGRYERRKGIAVAQRLSRETGLSESTIIESEAALAGPTPQP